MAERPLGITILGILWLIGGLIVLFGGVTTAFIAGLAFGSWGWIVGIIFIIWGLIELALGIGSFQGWPWVWGVGIGLALLGLLQGVYALITSGWGFLLSVLISAVILYYLFQPDVKAWFGRA